MSADGEILQLVAELHRRQGEMYAGSAVLGGEPVIWQTIGAYRADPERGLIREV